MQRIITFARPHNIRLYVRGLKGLNVLKQLISGQYIQYIKEVIIGEEKEVLVDSTNQIIDLLRSTSVHLIDFHKEKNEFNGISIVIGWDKKLTPSDNTIIIHDSLLPKYRGFAPLVSSLINGDYQIGATAIVAADQIDCGDIIFQEDIKITPPVKIIDAIEKVSNIYSSLIIQILNIIIEESKLYVTSQNNSLASYSLWRDEEDYKISWEDDAAKIMRFVYAIGYPYKGGLTYLNGQALRVLDCCLVEDLKIENRVPGKTIYLENGCPIIVCGSGLLKITNLVTDANHVTILPIHKLRSRFV